MIVCNVCQANTYTQLKCPVCKEILCDKCAYTWYREPCKKNFAGKMRKSFNFFYLHEKCYFEEYKKMNPRTVELFKKYGTD